MSLRNHVPLLAGAAVPITVVATQPVTVIGVSASIVVGGMTAGAAAYVLSSGVSE